jgi:hypothetical protein
VKGFDARRAFLYVGSELDTRRSEPTEEDATMTPSEHPDSETLERFVLGRLDRRTMATVEGHLRDCSRCAQVAMQVPDDALVRLLRASTSGSTIESSSCSAARFP